VVLSLLMGRQGRRPRATHRTCVTCEPLSGSVLGEHAYLTVATPSRMAGEPRALQVSGVPEPGQGLIQGRLVAKNAPGPGLDDHAQALFLSPATMLTTFFSSVTHRLARP
jgi:hypothetical protein